MQNNPVAAELAVKIANLELENAQLRVAVKTLKDQLNAKQDVKPKQAAKKK